MALTIQIGLTTTTGEVRYRDLPTVAAALQKQVARDVAGPWELPPVVVAAFPSPAKVPPGFWHVTLRNPKKGDGNWLGYHSDTKTNQPVAWVHPGDGWEATVSHEVIEMVVDPFGNRMMVGPHPTDPQTVAHYLVEACDPPEAYTYGVGGVQLSDFILPTFYADRAVPGTKYSFCGNLPGPRTLARDGYLSFMVQNRGWFQWTWFGGSEPVVNRLGAKARGVPLRQWLDHEARRLCQEAKAA